MSDSALSFENCPFCLHLDDYIYVDFSQTLCQVNVSVLIIKQIVVSMRFCSIQRKQAWKGAC